MEKLDANQLDKTIAKMPKFSQEVAKLVQSHEALKKQLAAANGKLEAIKKALPLVPQSWGSGPKAFVEKIRSIIDAP